MTLDIDKIAARLGSLAGKFKQHHSQSGVRVFFEFAGEFKEYPYAALRVVLFEDAPELIDELRKTRKALQHLVNKSNVLTSHYRHGTGFTREHVNALYDAQLAAEHFK